MAQIAISGNGIYLFNNVNTTPTYNSVPQQAQLDQLFKMYKYWTPKFVKIKVLPKLP